MSMVFEIGIGIGALLMLVLGLLAAAIHILR